MNSIWLKRVPWIALMMVLMAGGGRTASASPIAITGTASEIGANSANIQFSGSGVNVFSSTSDFGTAVLFCNPGGFCNMTLTVPTSVAFEGFGTTVVDGLSNGSLSGVAANAIGGQLTFSGGAFIPDGPFPADITIPVMVAGTIQGFNVTDCPEDCPATLLWSLTISGTGEASFVNEGDNPFFYQLVNYTFAGTATPTPEPGTLILLAAGLSGIALNWGRKRPAQRAS